MFLFHLWWFDHTFQPRGKWFFVCESKRNRHQKACTLRAQKPRYLWCDTIPGELWADITDREPTTNPRRIPPKPPWGNNKLYLVVSLSGVLGESYLWEQEWLRPHHQRPAPAGVTAHRNWTPGAFCTLGEAVQQLGEPLPGSSAGLMVSLISPCCLYVFEEGGA